jgi:hypothetical protein
MHLVWADEMWRLVDFVVLVWIAFLLGNAFALHHAERWITGGPDEIAAAAESCRNGAGLAAVCLLGAHLVRWLVARG